MQCEVIVVGGGIGGLTTAALLAARGIDVCVFERQSQVGGCLANFDHLGYSFEPTAGLYSGWGDEGAWKNIFADLPVEPPQVSKLTPNYTVRLPSGDDVAVADDPHTFEANITAAFPDCANSALHFFETIEGVGNKNSAEHAGPVARLLQSTSRDFRMFVDAQLQTFAQCASAECSTSRAAAALRVATGSLWSITGGGQALADRLVESLKRSGGSIRLNSPVLRLAYATDGAPIGVDLLSGERVIATRAIVSNLTIWDTYGKLIGIGRTPQVISAQLKQASAWGAYLMFIGIDEQAANEIPSRLLVVNDSDSADYEPPAQQLTLNCANADDARAPAGKRALTAWAFTHADDWFSFHEDSSAHESRDQAELEKWWGLLHSAMPELGDRVEVIETATPQTFYETTRRKFGMIGAPSKPFAGDSLTTPFPNVFVVSDTASPGVGIEGLARSAVAIADEITSS